MIRLTVLYNLPSDADEEEFLRWRLTDHQAANAAIPGVQRTDFARIDAAWPQGTKPPYRFMTIAEWPDRETFEKAFYEPKMQASLQENVKKLADPVFLISEILTSS
jgi:uncharacterized protein (TIGR02118 family)